MNFLNLSWTNWQKHLSWYHLGMLAIFIVSLLLRFWGLEQFNSLVFDEVYYAKFANNYLIKTQFFNAHPPLSQYIIAVGIWLASSLPIGETSVNGLTGSILSPWDYRWLNALTGSFIPLVVGGLAYQLTRRKSYGLIAALLVSLDGLFLVESRYALNNIYLVLFGLLGQVFFLKSLEKQGGKKWLSLIIAGIWFGASFSIKWNGLWFLLGIYLLLITAWGIKLLIKPNLDRVGGIVLHPLENLLSQLTQLSLGQVAVSLLLVPIFIYCIEWIPHLQQNPSPNFWEMQNQILSYHQRVGSGQQVHPYCSTWYSWIFMIRPIAYFYKSVNINDPSDPVLPTFPQGMTQVIYDVHAMGNPLLWWFSAVAILSLIGILIAQILMKLRSPQGPQNNLGIIPILSPPETWLIFYFIINWVANLLPWMKVTRCIFLYHYMGSSIFAGLALAWWIDRWLHSPKTYLRGVSVTLIFLFIASFIFWLPIYLGLPLTPQEWQMRIFLPNWI